MGAEALKVAAGKNVVDISDGLFTTEKEHPRAGVRSKFFVQINVIICVEFVFLLLVIISFCFENSSLWPDLVVLSQKSFNLIIFLKIMILIGGIKNITVRPTTFYGVQACMLFAHSDPQSPAG